MNSSLDYAEVRLLDGLLVIIGVGLEDFPVQRRFRVGLD